MIPIEKISGGTLSNIVLYVSIVGLLLVVASFIRLKVPLFEESLYSCLSFSRNYRTDPGTYAFKKFS